jgi:MFS family permease
MNEKNIKTGVFPNQFSGTPKGFKNIFKNADVIFVLLLMLTTQIGIVYHSSFIGAYIIELGYNQFYVGIFSALSAISEVPILLIINKLQKFFGPLKLLYLSCFMAALRLFLVSFGNITVMLLAQLLQSVSYMTSYYCSVTYIRENTYHEKSALGQSIMVIFQTGIASIFGSAAGGLLFQYIGFPKGFRLASLMVVILTVIIIFIYKNRHKPKIIT